jgi:tRNA(fMet)-specific endonuclease VapC
VGLLVDTNVWIFAEKQGSAHLDRWRDLGKVYMSTITVSELFVGVERANNPARKAFRQQHCEALINRVSLLDFDVEVAKVHAQLMGKLPKGLTAPIKDSMIAATALCHGHAVLTHNVADFQIFPGLVIEAWTPA